MKPGITPELTDTQTIHALVEYEERERHDADQCLIDDLAEAGTIRPTVIAAHRDLPLRVQIDPDVLVIELSAALAYSGFTLVNNPEVGGLYLTYARGLK